MHFKKIKKSYIYLLLIWNYIIINHVFSSKPCAKIWLVQHTTFLLHTELDCNHVVKYLNCQQFLLAIWLIINLSFLTDQITWLGSLHLLTLLINLVNWTIYVWLCKENKTPYCKQKINWFSRKNNIGFKLWSTISLKNVKWIHI